MSEIKKYMYLGKEYPLKATVDSSVKKATITFDGEFFICKVPKPGEIDIAKALLKFYKRACRTVVNQRLRIYQPQIKIKYKDVTIENNDKRWGSCSSNRNLTFNWRLVIFPIEALDYVVVHELCHLKHLNHDRSFWRLLGKILPDYKNAMAIIGSKKTRDM